MSVFVTSIRRLSKLEQQYERLLRTLNEFLKRVKAVIREKLGVSLD